MKIVKLIMVVCLICCGMAASVTAELSGNSNDYEQLVTEISKLTDNNSLSPIVRQLAIGFVEKNVKRLIKTKQKQIQRLVEDIEYFQERLHALSAGELIGSSYYYNDEGEICDYYADEGNVKQTELDWVTRIENDYAKIPECQEQVRQYEELLSQVQTLK